MQRVALNRSNPAPRLTSIASASARRQAAAVPVVVDIAVDAVAAELGTSISTLNGQLEAVESTLLNVDERLAALETA